MEANDDRVEQVSRETVLGAEAYMLFYIRDSLRQPAMVAESDKRRVDGCLAEHLPASKRLRFASTPAQCFATKCHGLSLAWLWDAGLRAQHFSPAARVEACGADVSAGSSVTEFELTLDSPLQNLSKAPEAPPPEPCRSLPSGALTSPRLNGTASYREQPSKADGAGNGAACTARGALPQPAPSVPQETQGASPVVWGHDLPGLPPGKPLEVGLDMVDRQQVLPTSS